METQKHPIAYKTFARRCWLASGKKAWGAFGISRGWRHICLTIIGTTVYVCGGVKLAQTKGVVLTTLVLLIIPVIVLLGACIWNMPKASYEIYKELQCVVKNQEEMIKQFEESAKIKLSIEGVKCQWIVNDCCICSVTIRNISESTPADNVTVRVEGVMQHDLGYAPGFNPFHHADLLPSNGAKSINPGQTADFLFHKEINDLVFNIGHRMGFPVTGMPTHGRNITQIFKLMASSSTSPPVAEEFIIVQKDFLQAAIIKNSLFQSLTPSVLTM